MFDVLTHIVSVTLSDSYSAMTGLVYRYQTTFNLCCPVKVSSTTLSHIYGKVVVDALLLKIEWSSNIARSLTIMNSFFSTFTSSRGHCPQYFHPSSLSVPLNSYFFLLPPAYFFHFTFPTHIKRRKHLTDLLLLLLLVPFLYNFSTRSWIEDHKQLHLVFTTSINPLLSLLASSLHQCLPHQHPTTRRQVSLPNSDKPSLLSPENAPIEHTQEKQSLPTSLISPHTAK